MPPSIAVTAATVPHNPSSTFTKKKASILSSISTHSSTEYTDKSPKGSIDVEIIDLIDEINAFEGYVTTSSCAGRVAVFVEGRRKEGGSTADPGGNGGDGDDEGDELAGMRAEGGAGPGGKGFGNKWLYVSHSPEPLQQHGPGDLENYHDLFGLQRTGQRQQQQRQSSRDDNKDNDDSQGHPSGTYHNLKPSTLRLIKLTFSPLILHILCSSLHTAKPLLAAAINAGFRESGVQSLKALHDEESGVMVAIRTAGCGFETVVGYVEEDEFDVRNADAEEERYGEVYRSVVDEAWLKVCVGVVLGRFEANVARRERLRGELRELKDSLVREQERQNGWEDKEARWRRKREEGLRKKELKADMNGTSGDEKKTHSSNINDDTKEDVLGDGLFLDGT